MGAPRKHLTRLLEDVHLIKDSRFCQQPTTAIENVPDHRNAFIFSWHDKRICVEERAGCWPSNKMKISQTLR